MKLNQKEQTLGFIWLLGAGAFAIALLMFLILADLNLTYGNHAFKADRLLSEVRLAQTSLGSAENVLIEKAALSNNQSDSKDYPPEDVEVEIDLDKVDH